MAKTRTTRTWNRQLLQKILDVLPVGVWILDARGRIVHGNPAGRKIWAGARYVGIERFGEYQGWWLATGKRIKPQEWAAARAITKGEVSLGEEVRIRCFDGARKVIVNSAAPLRDAGRRIIGAIIVNQDITQRKRAEARLKSLADRDPLTNAYNRRWLFEQLERETRRASRYDRALSLLMFDIDHFKRVNDRYGHDVGDKVLKAIAEVIQRSLRKSDTLSRYGGEEFVVLAPEADLKQAKAIAEKLRLAIGSHSFRGVGRLTCSFGVCEFRGDNPDGLVKRADAALYKAKQRGRNRVAAD